MAVVTLRVLVVLAIRSILDFSPFSSAVGVGELSNGLDAVPFPPVEQTPKGKPAAAAQKGRRAKNGPKTGEKGLKSELSPFSCTFCVGVLSGGLGAASFPPVEQTIALVSQQRRQKCELGVKNRPKTGGKGLAQITTLWNIGAEYRKTV